MASPGLKRGSCGHLMAAFDKQSYCAHCCEKSKGTDPCTLKREDCPHCNIRTETCNNLAKDKKTQRTPDTAVAKDKGKSSKRHSLPTKSSKPYTFNKPEATFKSVTVTAVKPPLAGAVETTEPFLAPNQLANRSKFNSSLPTNLNLDDRSMSINKLCTDWCLDSSLAHQV